MFFVIIGIVPASALVFIHVDFDDVFLKFKLQWTCDVIYFSSTIRPRHNLPVSKGAHFYICSVTIFTVKSRNNKVCSIYRSSSILSIIPKSHRHIMNSNNKEAAALFQQASWKSNLRELRLLQRRATADPAAADGFFFDAETATATITDDNVTFLQDELGGWSANNDAALVTVHWVAISGDHHGEQEEEMKQLESNDMIAKVTTNAPGGLVSSTEVTVVSPAVQPEARVLAASAPAVVALAVQPPAIPALATTMDEWNELHTIKKKHHVIRQGQQQGLHQGLQPGQREEQKLSDDDFAQAAAKKNVPVLLLLPMPTVASGTVGAPPPPATSATSATATVVATAHHPAIPSAVAAAEEDAYRQTTTYGVVDENNNKNDNDDDDEWINNQATVDKKHANVVDGQATRLDAKSTDNNEARTVRDDGKRIIKETNQQLLDGEVYEEEAVPVPVPTLIVRDVPLPTLKTNISCTTASGNSSSRTNKSTAPWITPDEKLQQHEKEIVALQNHVTKLQVALEDDNMCAPEAVQELVNAAAHRTMKLIQDIDSNKAEEMEEKRKAAAADLMVLLQQQRHHHDSASSTIMLLEAKLGRLNADMEDMRLQFETFVQENLAHYEQYHHDQLIMQQQSLLMPTVVNAAIEECYEKAYRCNNVLSAVIFLLLLYIAIGSYWMKGQKHGRRFRQQQQQQQEQQEEAQNSDTTIIVHDDHHKKQNLHGEEEMGALFQALMHRYAKLDAEQRTAEFATLIHNNSSNNPPHITPDEENHGDSNHNNADDAGDEGSTGHGSILGTRMERHKHVQEQQQRQTTTAPEAEAETTAAAAEVATTATGDESSCLDITDDDTMPSLMEPEIMLCEGEDDINNNNNFNIKEDKCVVSWNTTLETIESKVDYVHDKSDDTHDFELIVEDDHHSTNSSSSSSSSSWGEQQEATSSSKCRQWVEHSASLKG
jgi:hypothetical protein